jgi:hypothetical protein
MCSIKCVDICNPEFNYAFLMIKWNYKNSIDFLKSICTFLIKWGKLIH